jgi:two-component system catabolic regulation response regulator CreB/two-component system response regulator ChvI
MDKEEPSDKIKRNRRRIMAVDDDPDITLTIKVGLEDDGSGLFEVDTFNDPEQALSYFKPGLYSIVLLDFRMPKMNGYELYDKIKKIDSKVKVCFMSATYVNYEAAREIFPSLDIECFIHKPVEINDLIRRINAELGN